MALIPAVEVEVIPVNNNTKAAILVFGSQDGRTWVPVSGTLDYRDWIDCITVHRWKGVYKYFSLVYAGRVERTELKHVDIRLQERYTNKER